MSNLRVLVASVLLLPILAAAPPAQEGRALYEVTFTSTWSKKTHPKDFPAFPHYSPLIGGVHDARVTFWRPGGIASPGIESMAETGSPVLLAAEVQAAIRAGRAAAVVAGPALGVSPGRVSTRFEAVASHPRLTITTMLAPSPDWFVGLNGVLLRDKGRWIDRVVLDAHAWDAGTDSGTTYNAPDKNTFPKEPIALVTARPSPFQGYSSKVGTWTIRRVAATDVYGCGVNPAGSMGAAAGVPLLGRRVLLGLHDPTRSIGSGATAYLVLAAGPDRAFPCGTRLPGFGLGAPGAQGELLIDASLTAIAGSATWNGAAVLLGVDVPNDMTLAGSAVYAQGVFVGRSRLGLTDAAALLVGK